MKQKILVVGGLGVVGRAAVDHMTSLPEWDVVALSRRAPDFQTRAQFISADLSDARKCRDALSSVAGITHVVYAALQEQDSIVAGWTDADQIRVNRLMMSNLLNAVEPTSPQLRHITLMQGGKAYGVHLGSQLHIPYKESAPRPTAPNFYFDQEDLLREHQARASWNWTILRPPGVCGTTVGSPMNTVVAIGVYAAICRELGLPFRYPGGRGNIKEVCDARLLARSIAWSATSPTACNQTFNISNGDVFVWENIWPRFAEIFGISCAAPHEESVSKTMPDKGAVWDRIAAKHGLRPYSYHQLVPSWDFVDFTFRYGRPPSAGLMSTIKIRQAGFADCVDTEQMFIELLTKLQRDKVLPV
jgi:nucleoside-diphosphate-sugar epimerase